jgi:hypothetical protein
VMRLAVAARLALARMAVPMRLIVRLHKAGSPDDTRGKRSVDLPVAAAGPPAHPRHRTRLPAGPASNCCGGPVLS